MTINGSETVSSDTIKGQMNEYLSNPDTIVSKKSKNDINTSDHSNKNYKTHKDQKSGAERRKTKYYTKLPYTLK